MKNEKLLWREEDDRKSRGARRRRIERKLERDDEILIKKAIMLFNGYNGYNGEFTSQMIS